MDNRKYIPIESRILELWLTIEQLKQIYGGEDAMRRDYPIMHQLMQRYQNEMHNLQQQLTDHEKSY